MTELIQFFAVLLAAFGAVSLGWLRGVEPVRQQMAHQPAAQLFRLGPGEILQRPHVSWICP